MKKVLILFSFFLIANVGCTISDPEMMELLQEIKAQNDKLLQEVEAMKGTLALLDGKYQVILASLADNKKELEALKSQIDALKAQIAQQLIKIDQLSAQLTQQGADIIKLSQEIKELKASVEELKGLIEELLSCRSPVPTNGLIAWYPFNGNANDESGNGNNGIVNGATLTSDRSGNSSKAYFFSSANCATRIDADVNTTSITSGVTISLWFKKTGAGCISPRIIEFWPGLQGPGILSVFWASPENVIGVSHAFQNNNGYEFKFPAGDELLNKWVNFIYTHDGSVAKTYFNGELINSKNTTGTPILGSDLAIGRMNHPGFDAFNGNIDDFALWGRALSANEITKIYKGEKF